MLKVPFTQSASPFPFELHNLPALLDMCFMVGVPKFQRIDAVIQLPLLRLWCRGALILY
jgi:hypothetical protein